MADSVISPVATKVFECLVDLTISQGRYLFCTKKIIKYLEKTRDELTSQREDIQDRVQQAKRRTEIIEKPVERWLNEVSSQLEEAEKLMQEMEANNNWFRGCCPPWRRYRIAKQMVEKTSIMTKLINESDINPFSHLASLQSNYYNSNKNFTHFESTKLIFDDLLKALQDDDTYIIGLYGMGGTGKTSLATEVGKWAKETNLVDLVLSITVSQDPSVTNIQEKLAEKLNLELRENFEEGRAERLRLRLKEEKRVLIIVDDLWEQFNLNHIGIDFDTKDRGMCKVLLTSRRERVCNLMNCQKFQLKPLSEEEAWILLQKFAGIDDQFPSNLLDVANKVAKECKGLPIALKAVGSSLKGISREFQADEWKLALQKLKASIPIEGEGEEKSAISSLNLSYEYLKNKEAKLLFLMCAMFPEDHLIYIEDLVRYGAGLGIGAEFASFESARSSVKVALYKLIDFGLLLHFENEKYYVKMHDLARDTALWIASKEHRNILVNLTKDLNTFLGDKDMRQCFGVSSWYNKIDRISQQLDAPKLEIMILNAWSSLDLSYMSFELMKRLMVMAIINEGDKESISLPQSIQSLTNLKTLRLRGWHLGDITFILSLEGLEVLDLQYCDFNEIPDKIEKLQSLKLLDLRHAYIGNYNSKAIGRCSQLEEFYVCDYGGQHLVHDVTPASLLRFEIVLGYSAFSFPEFLEDDSIMGVLFLDNFDVSNLVESERNLLQRAEFIYFTRLCGGSKNIVPDVDQAAKGMNELTRLYLASCSEIQCLFDATSNYASSFQGDALLLCRLITLRLETMENLTEVCRGEPPLDFFKKLEELYISSCPQLNKIFPRQCNLNNLKILNISYKYDITNGCGVIVLFSMFVAKNMQQLEELTIEGCPELRHVITSDAEDGASTREVISLAPNNSYFLFPNLRILRISDCPKLQVIFSISCVQPNEIQIMLPHLQVFELHDLENLLSIFPQNYNSRWASVMELSWKNCPKLTTTCIGLELRKHHQNKEVVYDEIHQEHVIKLQELTLINLPESSLLWLGPTATQALSFQYLQCLKINGFKGMKVIFSIAVLRTLSGLTSLNIGNCDELVEIVENEESKNSAPIEVFFPKLSKLKIKQCSKLKNLFSIAMIKMLPQLNTLQVIEATQLKEIFGQSTEGDISNEMETVVPNLKEMQLQKLPSFVNIYQGFMMHKVRLKSVKVTECPKFTPFLRAIQAIPFHHRTEEKLIMWSIALSMNQLCGRQMCPIALKAFLSIEMFNLGNNGAEGILQLQLVEEGQGGLQHSDSVAEKHLNSNLEILNLHELAELRFIWSGPNQFLGFHKLTSITVDGCPKLKTIFPATIVRSLQKLVSMTIRNCEELEEISELQVECFLNLWSVEVEKCNKLKCIFYADCMASRPYASMRFLCVRECSQLERIYSLKRTTEVDSEDHGEKEKLLELYGFELRSLPNFTEIGLGIKLNRKPPMVYKVEECPKYIQQFADSNDYDDDNDNNNFAGSSNDCDDDEDRVDDYNDDDNIVGSSDDYNDDDDIADACDDEDIAGRSQL